MLSFEICAQKKGSSIRRTSECQNSSSRHTQMGSFRALLCSLTQSQTPKGGTGSAWHGTRRQERGRSKLGSKLSHIGVTFATLLTRLKALSASMSRLIANRNRNEPTVLVRSLPDGLALVCQPGLGEYTGYQSEDLTGRAPLSLAKT